MQLIELMDKIFVIGIGLIGGSLCLKIRDINPNVEIYGIDISEEHLQQALESGIIDFKSSIDNISKANLVLLTTPVDISNNISNFYQFRPSVCNLYIFKFFCIFI